MKKHHLDFPRGSHRQPWKPSEEDSHVGPLERHLRIACSNNFCHLDGQNVDERGRSSALVLALHIAAAHRERNKTHITLTGKNLKAKRVQKSERTT